MKKIKIIGFFLKTGYTDGLKFGGYYSQYVPASKLSTHLI
jgi:hypothetical protein